MSSARFLLRMKHWCLGFTVVILMSRCCLPADAQDTAPPASPAPIATHPADARALHELLASLTSESDWPTVAPDPCVSGPQGILCEPDPTSSSGVLRVTSLQFGFLFTDANLVACSPTASLPSSLANFTFLTSLSFTSCFTHQPTPLPASLPTSLRLLTFTSNPALTGPIPPTLGTILPSLQRLVLSQNALTGAIPLELGSLRALVQLDLSHNQLTGPVPESLGALEGLVNLDLRWNQLQGAGLPFAFSRGMNQLQRLALSNNNLDSLNLNFTGTAVGLQALTFLDVSSNELRGELPSSLGELSRLEDLFLNSNRELRGSIPSSFGKLTSLVRLDLSNCGLEGAIPGDVVAGLRNLHFFSVRGNALSGEIPGALESLPVIFTLNLDGNRFTGAVPFSPEFVTRMGPRNLVLKPDNPGLCSSAAAAPLSQLLGLEPCPDSTSNNATNATAGSSSPSRRSPAPSSPASSRSGGWPSIRQGSSSRAFVIVSSSVVVVAWIII